MRGLTDREYALLEECTGPSADCSDDNEECLGPDEIEIAERLVLRGLLRPEHHENDEWLWDDYAVTPLGRTAMFIYEGMRLMGLAS
jgi:hypothetical protein